MNKKYFLITGCGGFIGFHLSKLLLSKGYYLIGIDNINSYYSKKIKNDRISKLNKHKKFTFIKVDISNQIKLYKSLFRYKNLIKCVYHLAAQAGVRYSITNPDAYIISNINGFFNIINFVKINKIKYFFYASSSSVYGDSVGKLSLSKDTSRPLSLYAATKKSNEIFAYSYSRMFNIKTIGLRFFTVYGPFGRPDMSIFKFTNAIISKKTLHIFNKGKHFRDFTYIDDAVKIIFNIYLKRSKLKNFNIFNISNGRKIKITKVINLIENYLNIKNTKKLLMPLQVGDINTTLSDPTITNKFTNIYSRVPIEIGIKKFIDWYKNYFKQNL